MRLAYYIKEKLASDERVDQLLGRLRSLGYELTQVRSVDDLPQACRALLSLGGDGTFLGAAQIAVQASLPILGVNFGRIGFLAGVNPDELPDALERDALISAQRDILQVSFDVNSDQELGSQVNIWPYAFNEMCISRVSASMLGIDVSINGSALPTYWADGLLVATGSGSTAYSLSVGGPICTPDTEVFIVAPISSHNLNVRPLVVPRSARIDIQMRSRDEKVLFSADNRSCELAASTRLSIAAAACKLHRLSTASDDFIGALRTRLLWGQDLRNIDK